MPKHQQKLPVQDTDQQKQVTQSFNNPNSPSTCELPPTQNITTALQQSPNSPPKLANAETITSTLPDNLLQTPKPKTWAEVARQASPLTSQHSPPTHLHLQPGQRPEKRPLL